MDKCPILKEIERQERIAQCARDAIRRRQRKIARLQEALRRESAAMERTRSQQLDRANALIADLLLVHTKIK